MAKLIDLNGLTHVYSIIKGMLADKLGKNDTAANAAKVNGLTVETAVPKNAKFTDTVYTHPSSHPASMITGLATIATSGSYNDLSDKPTMPEAIIVDDTLSSTSTNAIQNKAVAAKFDEFGTAWGQALAAKADTADLATVATSGSYNDLSNRPANIVQSVNNVKPDSNGNVNISTSSGGGVSTSIQNSWTALQSFDLALLSVEKYKTVYANGNSVKPSSVAAVYNATGSFTLDLTNFSYLLSAGQSLVFTAYIKANADYPLTITNGGTLKYIGSPSDLAITSAGLLLNIFITLDNSGNKTSIIQASKLS